MKNTHDTPDIITLEDFMPYRLSVLSNKVSTIIAATYEGNSVSQSLNGASWRYWVNTGCIRGFCLSQNPD
ncbi:hypothetical protein [Aliamphritea spongicola]|nr:hypothetical protein [Aliamphritea spongicola]